MTPTEWRKTEIKLKQRATKARNAAKVEPTLAGKLKMLSVAAERDKELHQHRLNYHSLVTCHD